jgi:hypothetical protein
VSGALAAILARAFERLVVGPPVFDPGRAVESVVVFPLFPTDLHPDPPDLLSLGEAMARGVRLTDTGVVGRVHVDNPLATTILAGESDLLLGPTQLRAVQFSCLVPPERRATVPVCCVEEGRPVQYQAEFTHADATPWRVRSFKMEQLARTGDPPQYWIWDSIRSYLQAAGTASATHDLHAILDRHAALLTDLRSAFPCQPGQVGVVSAVGQNLFLELYGDPEILEDRYEQALRSALVEAVVTGGEQALPPPLVPVFLQQVVEASRHSRLLPGRGLKESGRAAAFTDRAVTGAALVADGELIHLSAHMRCLGQGEPAARLRPELERVRAEWEDERPGFLADLAERYRPRRQRYQAFKDRIRPPVPGPAPVEEPRRGGTSAPPPVEPAPRPVPLSPGLHRFFLRLFSRE